MDPGTSVHSGGPVMTSAMFMTKGRLPIIHQAERSECALACLAMVLNFHGHRVDINSLRYRCRLSQHGITLKALVNICSGLNLSARPLRLEIADMDKLSLPAILHWNLDHYVVLERLKRQGLVIHDPASGRKEVGWVEAGRHFTGVALELFPAAEFRKKDERQKLTFSELLRNSGGMAGCLLQILALSLMLQLFAIALPFYTQILLDDVLVNYDVDLLKLLAGAFLLLVIFRQLTELVRSHVVLYLSNKVSFHFATSLCRHLLHLPQDYFSRRHLGDIVSRFSSINNVRDFLCSGIVEIVVDGVMVIGTLVLMCIYSSTLTTIALAGVLCYGLLRLATYKKLQSGNEEWINDRAIENNMFMENVSAIQGIKLSCREASRLASWQNCYVSALNSGIRVQKLGITLQFANGLLTDVENILLLLVWCFSVMGGSLSIGMLIAFISFKEHFYRSIFSLLDKLFEMKVLDVHLGRLADIAFCQQEIQPQLSNLPEPENDSGSCLVLENIAFRFDAETNWLFRDINLQISGSEKIALIGPTGCGKSTLLKIVASLVSPEMGRLVFNDRVLDQQGLHAYRAKVAGVMQNDSLLSGSILENITFFDATPDLDKAYMAARQAMLADEIAAMSMQYQTMVGSMGSALSGGQAQRILLARAIYQEPALLILDEATSHLDIRTEAAVNRELRKLAIPCLMVAHRPETVLQADRIYVLSPRGLQEISHDAFREIISKSDENNVITI